jgi:hypothetical protein
MAVHEIKVPFTLSAEDLENVIRPLVEDHLQRLTEDGGRTLAQFSDAIEEKKRLVQRDANEMVEKHVALRQRIDAELEALKDKVTKRANIFLIPVASAILLGGVIVLWSLVGGVTASLRREANDALSETRILQSQLNDKKTDLSTLSDGISAAKSQLEQLRAQSPAMDQEKRIGLLETSIRHLDSRIDTLFAKPTGTTVITTPATTPTPNQSAVQPAPSAPANPRL